MDHDHAGPAHDNQQEVSNMDHDHAGPGHDNQQEVSNVERDHAASGHDNQQEAANMEHGHAARGQDDQQEAADMSMTSAARAECEAKNQNVCSSNNIQFQGARVRVRTLAFARLKHSEPTSKQAMRLQSKRGTSNSKRLISENRSTAAIRPHSENIMPSHRGHHWVPWPDGDPVVAWCTKHIPMSLNAYHVNIHQSGWQSWSIRTILL